MDPGITIEICSLFPLRSSSQPKKDLSQSLCVGTQKYAHMFSLPATLWRKLLRLSLAYTPPERLDSYVYVATPIISDVHTPYRRTIVPHSPPLFSRPWFEPSPRFSSHHVPQCCVVPLWVELWVCLSPLAFGIE